MSALAYVIPLTFDPDHVGTVRLLLNVPWYSWTGALVEVDYAPTTPIAGVVQ
jgi:hypothetical protein